jgi:rhomboid family GlyGly-CTERM serine protease
LTGLLVAVALGVFAIPGGRGAWVLASDRLDVWRWFTAPFVHHGLSHLFWDLAVFALLAALVERRSRGVLMATVVVASAVTSGWVASSLVGANAMYGGLSGLDSALVAVLACGLVGEGGRSRALGSLLAVGFVAKTLFELASGGVLFADDAGVHHVPVVHLLGAVVGSVVGGLAAAGRQVGAQAARSPGTLRLPHASNGEGEASCSHR